MAKKAILVLEDGSVYEGFSFGAETDTAGEVVFNTSMTGYQEMLTDPSYAGQIVMPTYPLIGNYGINEQDFESNRIQVRGFVVREECLKPNHYLNTRTIHEYLAESGIPGIYGVDTRAITRKLRSAGVMRGMITSDKTPEQALAICQEIRERKLDVRWAAGINPVAISQELASAMKESGCRYLALGIDSASEKMLENYQKGFVKEDITRTVKLLTETGISFDYSVLFGGPGENMDTVRETIDFLRGVPQQVFFRAGIRIFKGTALETQVREEGVLQENHDMLSSTFYLSRDLGEDFMQWLDNQCEPHENWFTITKAMRQGLAPS